MNFSWDQVLAWRMRRQFLDPPGTSAAADVTRALCGVQAQVTSSAEMAIAVRQRKPAVGEVDQSVRDRKLVKTWAMRGTLHLLHPQDAGAYLSLVGAARPWEKASWQKNFGITPSDIEAMAKATEKALANRTISREELVAEIVKQTGYAHLEKQLRSGWGMALKPLAWMGHLCHGPADGNRVTFTRPDTWLPDWQPVPEPEQAAQVVIPAYLRAYGPATPTIFDTWLTRGGSRRAELRSWFAGLGDRLATVTVEGQDMVLLDEDVAELADTSPTGTVRLLPGFDQYILGPTTGDVQVIAPARRGQVSKTAGWISPVVVAGGRVAGVWDTADDALTVTLFAEAGKVDRKLLAAEAERIGGLLGRRLRLSVKTS